MAMPKSTIKLCNGFIGGQNSRHPCRSRLDNNAPKAIHCMQSCASLHYMLHNGRDATLCCKPCFVVQMLAQPLQAGHCLPCQHKCSRLLSRPDKGLKRHM